MDAAEAALAKKPRRTGRLDAAGVVMQLRGTAGGAAGQGGAYSEVAANAEAEARPATGGEAIFISNPPCLICIGNRW
jgi:hypothetical protein